MRNNDQENSECIALIGSVTQAMRAQSVLANAAIRTEVIKADSTITGRGCAYAILYPCNVEDNVRSVLQAAGIRARRARR